MAGPRWVWGALSSGTCLYQKPTCSAEARQIPEVQRQRLIFLAQNLNFPGNVLVSFAQDNPPAGTPF